MKKVLLTIGAAAVATLAVFVNTAVVVANTDVPAPEVPAYEVDEAYDDYDEMNLQLRFLKGHNTTSCVCPLPPPFEDVEGTPEGRDFLSLTTVGKF